jgi:beta-galactosidase
VHLDHKNRGVGTGACGPDTLPRYRIGGGRYRFGWRLRGFRCAESEPGALARERYTIV